MFHLKLARAALFMAVAAVVFASPLRAEQGTQGALKNIQGEVGKAWDKMAPEMNLDRQTYTQISQERLDKIQSGIKELRDKANQLSEPVADKEWNKTVGALERKKQAAESRFNELKNSDENHWRRAKSNLDHSLRVANRSLEKAADRVLGEKEATELKMQNRVKELDIRIKALEAHKKTASDAEKPKLEADIQRMKEAQKNANQHLDAIKKDKTGAWKAERDALEGVLDKAF